jgi:hypothetical protein
MLSDATFKLRLSFGSGEGHRGDRTTTIMNRGCVSAAKGILGGVLEQFLLRLGRCH